MRKRTTYDSRAVVLSALFHALLLALALVSIPYARSRAVPPTRFLTVAQIAVAGGSHAVRIELPPRTVAAHTKDPAKTDEVTSKTILPIPPVRALRSGGGKPLLPHAGKGTGPARSGNGSDAQDLHPAFPVFSPRPPVTDRALLPATEKKIVVDVHVDPLGAVVGEILVKGMGNKLDQIVLETVKTWRFQPATIDGKPVPTDAELIFPFNKDYPITLS